MAAVSVKRPISAHSPTPPRPPPKKKKKKKLHTIVSNFSWVLQSGQEKSKAMVMQILGGKQGALWYMWKW